MGVIEVVVGKDDSVYKFTCLCSGDCEQWRRYCGLVASGVAGGRESLGFLYQSGSIDEVGGGRVLSGCEGLGVGDGSGSRQVELREFSVGGRSGGFVGTVEGFGSVESGGREGGCVSGVGSGGDGGVCGGEVTGDFEGDSGGKRSSCAAGLGSQCSVGESKLERNRRWREEKKKSKLSKQARGVDSRDWRARVPVELNESWVARKNAENELATLKAKKDLEFQKARDVDAESRKRRAAVMKSTERDKVAVEKAFATLKATGNVPGFCATVVDGSEVPSLSGGSGSPHDSISPDSSASMHEFRAVQKKNLDLEAKVVELERQMKLNMVKYGPGATYSLNEAYTVTPSIREELKKMEDDDYYVEEKPVPFDDYHVHVQRVVNMPEFPDFE